MHNSYTSNGVHTSAAAADAAAVVMVGESRLTLQDFQAILTHHARVELSASALQRVEASYAFLKKFSKGKLIYGIKTGIGPMAQYKIADADLNALQYNLIRSHSTGLGNL